jgi:DNA-binding MarR family transcriptional regulator
MSRRPHLDTREAIRVASFRAALRSFLGASDRVARASGLTPQRFLLLLMIKGAPDGSERATVTELAERLKLAQHSVTELAQRAEKLGLIEREGSELDGRVAHLRLTGEGERRLAEAFTRNDVARAELWRAIDQADRAMRPDDDPA